MGSILSRLNFNAHHLAFVKCALLRLNTKLCWILVFAPFTQHHLVLSSSPCIGGNNKNVVSGKSSIGFTSLMWGNNHLVVSSFRWTQFWTHHNLIKLIFTLSKWQNEIITTIPCVTSVLAAEKLFLSVTREKNFINFLLRFYKFYVRGDLSGHFAIVTKWAWMSQDVNPENGHFDDSRGSQQQNIFVNQQKINSESLFLRYGVILGCWKVPKRVQKLYTILLVILTKPYFTRIFWIAPPLKMRHVTHHVTVTFASRSLWTPVRVSFSSLYSFILLVFQPGGI